MTAMIYRLILSKNDCCSDIVNHWQKKSIEWQFMKSNNAFVRIFYHQRAPIDDFYQIVFGASSRRNEMNDLLLWAGAAILIIGLPIILARKPL
jgi:hypothetical protein